MHFTIAGIRYRIRFHYGKHDRGPQGHPREFTHCYIDQELDTLDVVGWPTVALAEVHRYYKDHDNKELARKAALTKVLARLSYVLSLTREQRAQVWEVYLHRADPKRSRAV